MPGIRRSTAWSARLPQPSRACAGAGSRSRSSSPRLSATVPVPELSGDPPRAGLLAQVVARQLDRIVPAARSISRPKARSAGPRAAGACAMAAPSPPRFHTRFPDYVALRTGLPADWLWSAMRRFHGRAEQDLRQRPPRWPPSSKRAASRTAFIWPRGVDLGQFSPMGRRIPRLPACRARSCSTSAGWRSRRISRPSSTAGWQASRSWSATARRWPGCKQHYPRRVASSARDAGAELAALYPLGRCVRLSQPHRHVRAGQYRGAGLRSSGRRLPGCGPGSTSWAQRARDAWRAGRGSARLTMISADAIAVPGRRPSRRGGRGASLWLGPMCGAVHRGALAPACDKPSERSAWQGRN